MPSCLVDRMRQWHDLEKMQETSAGRGNIQKCLRMSALESDLNSHSTRFIMVMLVLTSWYNED